MALSEEKRQQLLKSTREAAVAVLEDLGHLRELVGTFPPDNAEVRRTSSVLRRLLVEQGIVRVSGPRLGRRLIIDGPDNTKFYRSVEPLEKPSPAPWIGPNRTQRLMFFGS